MPNKIIKEGVQLGVVEHDKKAVSYINIYRKLENAAELTEETFRAAFNGVDFKEEVGYEYNSQPLEVSWAYIPVIKDGLINVKLLKLEQGSGIAIILPEQVATTYREIEEDITKLSTINQTIDLVGDVYGLDDKDIELMDLIKAIYINIGASAPAFELTKEGELEKSEVGEELGDDTAEPKDGRPPINSGLQNTNTFAKDLVDEGDTLDTIPEIEANMEAYKRLSKDTNSVNTLIQTLYETTPIAVRDHVKVVQNEEDNFVVIFVDNKAIYETFNTLPKHARKQITTIGETLRLNEATQLLDSFKYKDGRAFVVAENSHKNIWRVKNEEIKQFTEKNEKTLYISEKNDIIELEQSNISIESRRFVERKDGDKTLFLIK